ncbi:MAG: MOSC domain-containing protein [Anaerolineales bacterium]|nr:MOSC domain-containing protein [Anaerolineales bacterium]
MGKAEIVSIFIARTGSGPVESVAQVRAVPGKGLEGDRYFSEQGHFSHKPGPDRQATLIEIEALEALQREKGIALTPGEVRRNLVTRGVALNHLVGVQFKVGEAILKGIRLCEPCEHLEQMTQEGVRSGLIHRGGLRAEIVSAGAIRVGDVIEEI